MTTKKVEDKGLRILGDYFEECSLVDTYLSSNDKEPLWDGHLYLFNSEVQKAENVYGRIPTQVKTLSKTTSKKNIKYSISKSALNTFKRDGGLLYFVIYAKNPENQQIYYALLTPVVIKKYLRAPGDSASISVTLSLLPSDRNEVTESLFQFYFDCKKQTTSADKPIVELEDYFEKSGKRQFSVFAKTPVPVDDMFVHMQSHPLYMYATDDDQNITYPIGDGPVTLKIGKNIKQDISVNGVPYFNGCAVFDDNGSQVISIGNFCTVKMGTENQRSEISFNIKGESSFRKIPYLSFCLAIIKYKHFCIGPVKISCEGIQPSEQLVNQMKGELKILNQVKSLFKELHIKEDIKLDQLSSNELSNLEAFYKGIVLKEPLSLKSGVEKKCRFNIGPYSIYVMFYPCGDGKYQVKDFFQDEDVCCLLKDGDKTTKSSRYTLLDVDQYLDASNFDFSKMIGSYEAFVQDNEAVAQLANLDMLRMILAYDKSSGKKTALLDAAEALNNWFISTNRFMDSPINDINRLQIIKRRRPLTEEETSHIFSLLDKDISEDCKTACMLLIENQLGAEFHFKKIPDGDKEFFKTLPIYHFWKNTNA